MLRNYYCFQFVYLRYRSELDQTVDPMRKVVVVVVVFAAVVDVVVFAFVVVVFVVVVVCCFYNHVFNIILHVSVRYFQNILVQYIKIIQNLQGLIILHNFRTISIDTNLTTIDTISVGFGYLFLQYHYFSINVRDRLQLLTRGPDAKRYLKSIDPVKGGLEKNHHKFSRKIKFTWFSMGFFIPMHNFLWQKRRPRFFFVVVVVFVGFFRSERGPWKFSPWFFICISIP